VREREVWKERESDKWSEGGGGEEGEGERERRRERKCIHQG
jgi:hypothetical protein